MQLAGSTYRPKVSEILQMPLRRFRQAQAGALVTLGDEVAESVIECSRKTGKLTGSWTRKEHAETRPGSMSCRAPPTCDVKLSADG